MLKILDINDNPYVGVYVAVSDSLALVPPVIDNKTLTDIEEAFSVPVITTTIGNVNILGSLVAMNSKGIVLSNIVNNNEFQILTKETNAMILREKNNALGNMMLVSEDNALIAPGMTKRSERIIRDVLDVETRRGTIAGLDTVGMASVITSKGLLCHPKITTEERDDLEDLFDMKVSLGTVNFGIPLIGAGLVSNSHGAIVGSKTTGVELNRIEHALDLI